MDGVELKTWRLFMGLKQSDVAQMFGLTEKEVIQIESGKVAVPRQIARHPGRK